MPGNCAQVTITGADDNQDIAALLAASEKYPFVEWGLLIGKNNSGNGQLDFGVPKYPSEKWFNELNAARKDNKRKFSVHICDDWALNMAEKGDDEVFRRAGDILQHFDRIQINFVRSLLKKRVDKEKLFAVLDGRPQTFVFQLPNFDKEYLDLVREARKRGIKADPFFDTSGGRGLAPADWPVPSCLLGQENQSSNEKDVLEGSVFGYSGGLGPDNIAGHLKTISNNSTSHSNYSWWVDMETKVRSEGKFDLEKVAVCLEAARPYLQSKWA